MTTTTDFERLVGAWLETSGPLDVPAPAVDAALGDARRIPQRRGIRAWLGGARPWPGTARRTGSVPVALRLAVVLALLAAVAALAAIVGSRVDPPDPADLRGTWVVANPGVPGLNATGPEVRLLFEADAVRVRALVGDAAAVGSARMPSDIEPAGESEFMVTATRDAHGCRAGDTGRYRWSLSRDRVFLTLALVEDQCAGRGTLFSRTWARDLSGPSTGGTGVVHAFDPAFMVTLPPGNYTVAEGVPDAVEILEGPDVMQLMVFKDLEGFGDACSPDARLQLAPGVDALVDYFREAAMFSTVTTLETTLDGHRAVRVRMTARTTDVCDAGYFNGWVPAAVPDPWEWHLAPGDTDDVVIVEVDGSTLMFGLLPIDHPARDAIFESIRFLDGLPTGP